jgi:putative DNA primase/helicase
MAVARVLLRDLEVDGYLTLRSWRGGWMRWESSHWGDIEERELRAYIYRKLELAQYDTDAGPKAWKPNRHKVADVLAAFAAVAHLPESVDSPSWLVRSGPHGPQTGTYPAWEIVACANGLLHVGTRELLDPTPHYFNRVAVPFDYDPDAPEPGLWFRFLKELWADDPDSIAALQEFFGYVLSGRTDLHKILLMVGPTRSGKGTIARVLTALIGKGNAAGPTLASLGSNFGLSPLLGKPLAVVSDARLGGANVHQVVERLLSVSGEDMLTVDRKYRDPWTGKLQTRFVVLSNELPRFGDASGAIARRFVVTTMHKSFLGHENTRLTAELLTELPGILAWALDGLDRLATSSAFTEPASSVDAITALQDLVSPTAAFVRDSCTTGAGIEISVADLYTSWKAWCEDNGHKASSVQTFGRDLRAVVPQLRIQRPWNDDRTRAIRRYAGITLNAAHTGVGRGPSRSNNSVEVLDRAGPRSKPLWAAACSDCTAPLDAPPTVGCHCPDEHEGVA